MLGLEVGNYVLESPLGRGGMGEVYLARHKSLGTPAAIKVLTAVADEPQVHDRFQREARTQAQLSHPNVARVLDYVYQDARWYLVMEYMPRGTLRDALREKPGPVGVDQALEWTRQALRGLEHAHRQGVVHRDVKPGNILLNDRGECAVTDFGLAKITGGTRLTRTGTAMGTPAYMSPEQLSAEHPVDQRSDLYSMGVVLYEMLTGRVPFPMETASEVVRILVNEPPPLDELNPDLPPELSEIVLRSLAKDPNERYADAGEFAGAIEAFRAGSAGTSPVPVAPPSPPQPPPPQPPPLPPQPPQSLEPTLIAPSPDAEPTAILSPDAQRTPPPVPSRRRTSAGTIAAMVAVLAAGMLALAAGAAYLAWPKIQERFGVGAIPPPETPSPETPPPETPPPETPPPETPSPETPPAVPLPLASAASAPSERPVYERPPPELPVTERPLSERASLGPSTPESPASVPPPVPRPSTSGPPPESLPADPSESSPSDPPPPVRRPTLPVDPTVAVIAVGDPLFARDFEHEIEGRLQGLGIQVADEHNSVVVSDVLRRWRDEVAVPELLPLLEEAGFHAVVVIQVEYVGSRQLQYLGRTSEAHQARLRLNAYLTSGEGALGPGWNEDVEYTELSAGRKAEAAMLGATNEMSDAIRLGWREYQLDVGGSG